MDTYINLRTAITDFIGRADLTTARCDYLIDLTESWFNANLRVRSMETTNGSMTAVSGVITNPTDFLAWKNLAWFSGRRYAMQPSTTELQDTVNPGGVGTGIPSTYYATATTTKVVPGSSGQAQGTYYQKVPALGPSQTSNWLLASYPDAYMYGCLAMAEAFYYDDQRIPVWKELFSNAVSGVRKQEQMSGQAMQMRLAGPTP